jgi:hypothetical protein
MTRRTYQIINEENKYMGLFDMLTKLAADSHKLDSNAILLSCKRNCAKLVAIKTRHVVWQYTPYIGRKYSRLYTKTKHSRLPSHKGILGDHINSVSWITSPENDW